MNSSEITTAVSEALQRHIPLIVEEVTTKLTKKEKWEDYSVEKLSAMAVSGDYKQRCSAAAHPRTPTEIINKLLEDPNHAVRKVAGANPSIPKESLNILFNTGNYLGILGRIKKEGRLVDILHCFDNVILDKNSTKKIRARFRKLIQARILNGDFDDELNNGVDGWYGIFNLNTSAKSLIIRQNSTTDNFQFFIQLMIKYRAKRFLQTATQDEKELLIHLMPTLARFMTTS